MVVVRAPSLKEKVEAEAEVTGDWGWMDRTE